MKFVWFTALVMELHFAFAGHVITTISLFDPEIALGTLLELLAFGKL